MAAGLCRKCGKPNDRKHLDWILVIIGKVRHRIHVGMDPHSPGWETLEILATCGARIDWVSWKGSSQCEACCRKRRKTSAVESMQVAS